MKYNRVIQGTFIDRPNRFIAYCEIDGIVEKCHVKNTGRCRELLVPGCRVVLSVAGNPDRKTPYDLVAVWKGRRLINMDSQAPNAVVKESIGKILGKCDRVVPEHTFGDSRFDFYAEQGGKRIILEVKGVTLEDDGVVLFPDAPTERGLKHVRELTSLVSEGFDCWICFLVQMGDVKYMSPNYATHMEFGKALEGAEAAGVHVVAYACDVEEGGLTLSHEVPVRFQ